MSSVLGEFHRISSGTSTRMASGSLISQRRNNAYPYISRGRHTVLQLTGIHNRLDVLVICSDGSRSTPRHGAKAEHSWIGHKNLVNCPFPENLPRKQSRSLTWPRFHSVINPEHLSSTSRSCGVKKTARKPPTNSNPMPFLFQAPPSTTDESYPTMTLLQQRKQGSLKLKGHRLSGVLGFRTS